MAKKGKKNNLAKSLAKAVPGLDSSVLQTAAKLSQQPELMRLYAGPSQTEKYYGNLRNNLKSDAQINAEQTAAYDLVRNQAANMQQSGANIGNAFASAMGAASGGLMNLAGNNAAAAQEIMNTGASAAAQTGAIGSSIMDAGSAAGLQALLQAQQGATSAKAMRDQFETEIGEKMAMAKDKRKETRATLASQRRSNLIDALSSVLGLQATLKSLKGGGSGGYSGSGDDDEADGNGGGTGGNSFFNRILGAPGADMTAAEAEKAYKDGAYQSASNLQGLITNNPKNPPRNKTRPAPANRNRR